MNRPTSGELLGKGGWNQLFRPDDLSVAVVARAPAFGELGDQEQAAAAFVQIPGAAQVRAVLLASETSHVTVD